MQEQSIFTEALEKDDPAERAAFLDHICASDPALRQRIERLLQRHEQSESFLESPVLPRIAAVEEPPHASGTGAWSATRTPMVVERPLTEGPGTVIGPYKLMEQIGEGGMGLVFVAEQLQPVRRKVALKVIKPGMDTRQVVARFEAERQALALMDHPHIAKVLDGGETASGRPYFVMELVKGTPITDYCDQHQLPVRERLELFLQVCLAVQHAHQKGIIHRDIKPTNVLVTSHDGTPVVRVIDFGVAKAIGQQLTDKTVYTEFAQLIGSPLYMSPEQAGLSSLDIDTRSDIYSLGVLLYELLTGTTPFEKERFSEVGYDEMRRIICEEEPRKPSTRISTLVGCVQRTRPAAAAGETAPMPGALHAPYDVATIATQRQSDPKRLSRLCRGELDWIVMKCLEKERDRRYETASGLARDVERYLKDEPVQACPPSAGYRLRKFARRNKRALATAALLGVMLLTAVGAVAGSIGWAARDRAERQAATQREVDLALREATRLQEQRKWPEALALVKRAEALLAAGDGGEEHRRWVRVLLTDLKMVALLEEIRLQQSDVKGQSFDLGGADTAFVAAFREYGVDVLALEAAEAAERIRASAIREPLVAALDDWAWIDVQGKGYLFPSSANTKGRHLLAVARLADPDDWRNRFREPVLQGNQRALEELAGRPEVASLPPSTVVLLSRALAGAGAQAKAHAVLLGAQQRHPSDFWLNQRLAAVRDPSQSWAVSTHEAVGFLRAALAVRPQSPNAHARLADLLLSQEKVEEAIPILRAAIKLQPDYVRSHGLLGEALSRKGNWDEAFAVLQKAIALKPNDYAGHLSLAGVCRSKHDIARAIAEYKEVTRLEPRLGLAQQELAFLLATCADPSLRDPAKALEAAEKAVALAPQEPLCLLVLGAACYATNDWIGAIAALEKANERSTWGNPYIWVFLAMAHGKQGNREQARMWYDRTLRGLEEKRRWVEGSPIVRGELPRFRAEAAELLGIETVPSPAATEAPPKKP